MFELNEAFAAQVLACIKVLELDPAKINPKRRRSRAYALTEPGAGSDALAARTRATLSPNGKS